MSGVIDGYDTEYYVLLGFPVSAVHHSVKLIFGLNTKISIFAVMIGMIGAWIAGRKFTKPILEIDKVARAVTELDFSKKVELTSREDEIGMLGYNINLMSSHLSEAMEKLQIANTQLEKDIIHQKNLDKMRKEFIANVSHKLKSPLALLTMSCANLKDGGMQEEDKNFYRVDSARTHNEDMHAGLGLYIVKTIMENHDGKYGVSNGRKGVTFWFSLNQEKKNFA